MSDIIIIGAGKSGLAAAQSAIERKRKILLLAKPGGKTGDLPPGVSIVADEIVKATFTATEKKLTGASGQTYTAPAFIFALGCRERQGPLEGEGKFLGHGVHYNVFQDGIHYEGKTVLVEGKGDVAIQSVLYLARLAAKIHFIIPAMKLDAEQKWVERLQKCPNVEMVLSASIKRIEGEDLIRSVTVLTQGNEKQIEAAGVFLLARHSTMQHEFLKGVVTLSEDGSVLVDEQFMTSIPGVFACGDMIAGAPQLPAVSTTQGILTAMYADAYCSSSHL